MCCPSTSTVHGEIELEHQGGKNDAQDEEVYKTVSSSTCSTICPLIINRHLFFFILVNIQKKPSSK
jgi:hypothetical protein